MRIKAILKILGMLLIIFSVTMLTPLIFNSWYHDGVAWPFIMAFGITWLTGMVLWGLFRKQVHEFKVRDGFLIVVLFWVVLSLFGCIPIWLGVQPHVSFTDALFECVSGLTTTGASVLIHMKHLSHAVLYYRQQLHLLGGMGIIVLAVAVLPMLGIGGMQLYRAEVPGALKSKKIKPRMAQTAKALWSIYIILIVACGLSYWLAGMEPFDALCESFSTISTGGFNNHQQSFQYFNKSAIESIGVVFMILSASNFGLHYSCLKSRSLMVYVRDHEWRVYMGLIVAAALLSSCVLWAHHFDQKFISIVFAVVSMSTTTGFTTVHFSHWPGMLPMGVMLLALLGGCGASTSGGLKIIRVLLLKNQCQRELKQLIHPQAILPLKLGGEILPPAIVQAVWAFSVIYALFMVLFCMAFLATGLDLTTAIGAAIATLSNCGAAIGGVADSFHTVSPVAKWIAIFGMIAGRLEIFTLLVLFTPEYWRR